MAGGYKRPPGDGLGPILEAIASIRKRLSELEIPTGTQTNELVRRVEAKLAELDATVEALVADYVASYSYTQATINSKIASPGAISPTSVSASGSVSAGGDVTAGAKVKGGNIYGNILSVDYRVVYVTGVDGSLGHVPSSARYKTNVHPANLDLDAVFALNLTTYQYKHAIEAFGGVEAAPVEVGLIAEEVDKLGLGFLVSRDEQGQPESVAYERLALALLPMVQDHERRLRAAGL